MTSYFVMIIFFGAGFAAGGVAVEKVGIYETQEACVKAATDAGIDPLPKNAQQGPYFSCIAASDPYGVE